MNRFPRSAKKARRRGQSGSRQAMAVVALAAALGLGALAADKYAVAMRPAPAAAPNDDEIYTGSILYMPNDGNVCRQLLFDNHNGRFTDNGYVDCERAAYQGSLDSPKQWSAARLRVISSGFLQH